MVELKICSKCEVEKDIEEFSWDNKAKGYRQSWCKSCMNEYKKQWYQDNKDYCDEYSKKYKEKNKSNVDKYQKEYQKQWDKQHLIDNRDKVYAKNARRRAQKLNQTPANASMSEIQKFYSICCYMNSISVNCKWHVDHIYPLSKGGLHHQDNLRILDAIANIRKSNKL